MVRCLEMDDMGEFPDHDAIHVYLSHQGMESVDVFRTVCSVA